MIFTRRFPIVFTTLTVVLSCGDQGASSDQDVTASNVPSVVGSGGAGPQPTTPNSPVTVGPTGASSSVSTTMPTSPSETTGSASTSEPSAPAVPDTSGAVFPTSGPSSDASSTMPVGVPSASGGAAGSASTTSGGSPSAGGTGGNAATGGAPAEPDPEQTDTSAATIVPDPSWDCGVPEGLPPPEQGELVFQATLEVGAVHEFGVTQYGTRRLLDVTGGDFMGDELEGVFLTGGLDLELTLSNGSIELEQIDILRASDGSLVLLRSCGFAPAGESRVRFVPDFEVANSSSLAWLNDGDFAGIREVDEVAGTIQLFIYDVSNVALGEQEITIEDPVEVPNQPWDCSTETGPSGATVLTETVTLGSSLSVGESKRGSRNIIPITGGSFTGRINGSVLPGGADYQLLGGTTTLDARYTLETEDGDYILVRNCGPFGALVPLFETRADGASAFLNENRFVSSDPGGATGGVSITFYERE